jgi:hypothetical protein
MTENTVKQPAFTAASAVSGLVQLWTHELQAANDNEEPEPPPAIAARIPCMPPFIPMEPRVLELSRPCSGRLSTFCIPSRRLISSLRYGACPLLDTAAAGRGTNHTVAAAC